MSYTLKDAERQWVNPYFGLPNRNISNLVADDDVNNINSTIKPIDREDSNLEAEKNELVLQPTGEVFTIRGKSHAKGGTPLNLPKGSFLFSNYKPLAISKEDKEIFKFKEGGSTKLANNTPAKVLSREIDIKHHNKMLAILKSDKHDEISKTSARLMLEKNLPKIGQVAFLQEQYKGFPDGIPDFSQGTAPEQENVDYMKKQFKMGGSNNPYLEKYQSAGKVKAPEVALNPYWNYLANERPDDFIFSPELSNNPNNQINSPQKKIQGSRYGNFDLNEFKSRQSWYTKNNPNFNPENPKDVLDFQTKYNNEATKRGYEPYFIKGDGFRDFDSKFGTYTFNAPGYREQESVPPTNPYTPPNIPYNPPSFTPRNPSDPKESVGQYYNEVPRSALQNLVLGNDMYNALNVKRLNPMRSQQSFVPLTQERINNQPYLNNINNQTASTRSLSQVMNPYQAAALQSKTLGQGLDKSSEILGNINNQNLQISNNENQFNVQGINATAAQNVGLNQSYYDQTQKAEGNYQNTKDILRNNALKTFVNQSADNEKLRMNLDGQQSFGSVYVDPKTNIPLKDTDLADKAKKEGITPEQYVSKYGLKKQAMAPMYFNPYTRRVEHSGINFDPRTMSSQSGMTAEQFKKETQGMSPQQIAGYSRFLASKSKQNPYN